MPGSKVAWFHGLAMFALHLSGLTPADASRKALAAHPPCAPFSVYAHCKVQRQSNDTNAPSVKPHGLLDAVRPSVLYISAHQGTAMDMAYVCNCLGIAFKWVVPSHLPYEVTREIAQDDWDRLHDYQCGLFDYIIVADTNAKGA